jgi:hypothetical protein
MKLTEEEKNQYVNELVRCLCKMQSAVHDVDKLLPNSPFYKNHKQRILNIESSLSTILNETTSLFGINTVDDYAEAVKIIDDAGMEIVYVDVVPQTEEQLLKTKIKQVAIKNRGIAPIYNDEYYCKTCGNQETHHPITDYCFVCNEENWQPCKAKVEA